MTREALPDELYAMPAGEQDLVALAALVNSAYRGETSRAGWTTEADLLGGQRTDPEALRAIVAAPGNVLLVLRAEPGPLACAHLQQKGGGVCHLGMLTVSPRLQGAGLGRKLLAAAENWAVRHMGATAIEMTVIDVREELIAWYERRGYERTGELRPFPYGDARFGAPLREDLRFAVLRRELPPSPVTGTRLTSLPRQ
jgi:ribosomal protein S18 acetylase RimI-like enzyme